ncbi:MAG: hypothetical protein NW200_09185 [Hyphomonadaceae bacterium]|nr:hypothetical protein [Hyphomonadaceae bacterium]
MRRVAFLIALAILTVGTARAESADLRGVWTAEDGSGAARIDVCERSVDRLCATVIAETPEPGAPSTIGSVVLSNLAPAGPSRWRGLYHTGTQNLPATIRARGADQVEMRVCVGIFCSTEKYRRTAR